MLPGALTPRLPECVVQPAVRDRGAGLIHTTERSYFSRRAEATTFSRLAHVATQRRGVATAGCVAGVAEGAAWVQGFLDGHRPDAVRILDFPHAAEYVARAGQAAGGAAATAAWLTAQLHEPRHGEPGQVLATLQALQDGLADRPAARATVATSLPYLAARRAQITYAAFAAAGLPIGRGCIERATQLVVAARLKGSGRPWAPAQVAPLLALRNAVCNGRWAEAWPQIAAQLRATARRCRQQRRVADRAAAVSAPPPLHRAPPPRPADLPCVLALPTTRHHDHAPPDHHAPAPTVPRPPAPTHPWRRYGHPLTPKVA